MNLDTSDIKKISSLLIAEKIGVLPTDTIYGLHCIASSKELGKKINRLKNREEDTPLITLISDVSELKDFGVVLNDFAKEQIKKYWPGRNTLIFKTTSGDTRAFRLPDNKFLFEVLNETGPLFSTSANKHGEPFALDIKQAQESFNAEVDFYVDGGVLENNASSMFLIKSDLIETIR